MDIADAIDFVIDDNSNKKGMLMPVGDLEIMGSDALYSRDVKLCLLGLNPQNHSKDLQIKTNKILFIFLIIFN